MKNYETPKVVLRAFSEQDVMTASSGINAFDDVGAWGNWFNSTEGGEV